MSTTGKNKRHRYLIGTIAASSALLIGFQNCSQTRFVPGVAESGKVVGIGGTEDPTAKCIEGSEKAQVLSVSQEELGPDFKVLGYQIGKVTCAYTSFLVKVKYLEQFETHLAFRTHRFTGKTELISKNESGKPQPIYSQWFATSADDQAVVYVPQKIVDRSPEPVKPEIFVRREINSGLIQIINKYDSDNKMNGQLIALGELTASTHKTFAHHASQSSDAKIVIFPSKNGHLIKKDLVTGSTADLNALDNKIDATLGPVYLRSYSLSGDGSKVLFSRSVGENSYILKNSPYKKGAVTSALYEPTHNSAHDGYDLKFDQKSLISADGKYAFFEAHFFGGRPFRTSPVYIVRMDIETKQVEAVSVVNGKDGAESYSIPNAQLKSVSADGRYACFLAPESFTQSTDQLSTSPVRAFVKDLQAQEVKMVSLNAEGGVVTDCSISATGKTVTYQVQQNRSAGDVKIFRASIE